MTTENLMVPSVHLNGTGRKTLSEQNHAAASAVNEAIGKLTQAAPNARDYYPQGPDAYARARSQHEARVLRLQAVYEELAQVYAAIEEA